MVEWYDLRTTLVAILLLHLLQILLHHLLTTLWVVEDLLQLCDELLQVVELLMELIDTQTCQLSQTHIYDSLRLELVQLEAGLQVTLSVGWGLTVSNNVYYLVDIVYGDDQSLEDMSTLLSLAKVVLGTTDSYIMTMFNEVLHTLLQGEQTWTSLHQGDIVYRE